MAGPIVTISNPFAFLQSNLFSHPYLKSCPLPSLQSLFQSFSQISFPVLLSKPFFSSFSFQLLFPSFSPIFSHFLLPIPIPSFSPISFHFHISIPYARLSQIPFPVLLSNSFFLHVLFLSFSPIFFTFFFPIPIPSSCQIFLFHFLLSYPFIRPSLQSLFPTFSSIPFPVLLSYPYSYPLSDPFTFLLTNPFSFSFLHGIPFPQFYRILSHLKGPKHDQVECGFFYTNQTRMVR